MATNSAPSGASHRSARSPVALRRFNDAGKRGDEEQFEYLVFPCLTPIPSGFSSSADDTMEDSKAVK